MLQQMLMMQGSIPLHKIELQNSKDARKMVKQVTDELIREGYKWFTDFYHIPTGNDILEFQIFTSGELIDDVKAKLIAYLL